MRHINPSGYVYYDNEAELCQELEKYFFSNFFNTYDNWKPIEGITKEVWLDKKNRIDYVGDRSDKPCFVEVKNWWITYKNIKQIMRYFKFVEKTGFLKYYVICGGIDNDKKEFLEQKCECIQFIITKDIKEINSMELVHWM